jgi:hypothetical protein
MRMTTLQLRDNEEGIRKDPQVRIHLLSTVEDMPRNELNSNKEASLVMQLKELENIHEEHLNSAATVDDMPSLMSGKSSKGSIDQKGRQRGRYKEGRQLQDESGKDIEERQ